MIKMFKCIDKVVGEIIESDNKVSFIEELNNRFEEYKTQGNAFFYFVKGTYYLGIR